MWTVRTALQKLCLPLNTPLTHSFCHTAWSLLEVIAEAPFPSASLLQSDPLFFLSFPILLSAMAYSPRHHEVVRGNTETRLYCVCVSVCTHKLCCAHTPPCGKILSSTLPSPAPARLAQEHTKTPLCVPANTLRCIRKYRQGHCSGRSEAETPSAVGGSRQNV